MANVTTEINVNGDIVLHRRNFLCPSSNADADVNANSKKVDPDPAGLRIAKGHDSNDRTPQTSGGVESHQSHRSHISRVMSREENPLNHARIHSERDAAD
jgi:hypothetical protein